MSDKKINTELHNLLKFINLEREEELLFYQKALENTSFNEQRKMGICWYPIDLESSKYDLGERFLITVSRMPEHHQGHNFQSGALVQLFRNTNNEIRENEFVTGVVNRVKEDKMTITLNCDELPDWAQQKNLGVQLLFDENIYKQMTKAVNHLLQTNDEKIVKQKRILLGSEEAFFKEQKPVFSEYLNTAQNKALNNVLNAQDTAIIHGPPGTGKTTTLVQAIIETVKKEPQVLVCAQSNAAVDLLVEKLSLKGINVVRLGHPARVSEEILQYTLDARTVKHESYKELRAVRRQADEYRKMAAKYKRHFGSEERNQRRELYKEARKLSQEAKQLAFYIQNDIISKAQVVACTLIGAAHDNLSGLQFNTVFIDEASQALEPASWIPIIKSQRVIFAGDHHQLPPTIKSYKAASEGFQETLFEKAIKRNNADVMLNIQYRMNEKIMQFSSSQFYDSQLIADKSVINHKLFESDSVFEFIDTAGAGFTEEINLKTLSLRNKEEASTLLKHLIAYSQDIETNDALRNLSSIGIISPYKEQTLWLKKIILENDNLPPFFKNMMNINTVDSFQGQERDVIYISLVRSNDKNKIGFLSDIRRMNVAITRARKKLVVIGDSATIAKNKFYSDFLDYVDKQALYRSAFEFLYS